VALPKHLRDRSLEDVSMPAVWMCPTVQSATF